MRPDRQISGKTAKLNAGFAWAVALILPFCLTIRAQEPQKAAADPKANPKQERHEQLLADTAKLLELANELKAEVDKSSKDMLSVPVVKKADEVGKLAKKLREEMKP